MGDLARFARPVVAGMYLVAAVYLVGGQILSLEGGSLAARTAGWGALAGLAWLAVARGIHRQQAWAAVFSGLAFPLSALIAWRVAANGGTLNEASILLVAHAPLQLLIPFFNHDAPVMGYASALSWFAYVVHLGLISGAVLSGVRGIRLRIASARKRRARKKVLELPRSAVTLYSHNPFNVLGLSPGQATTRAILRRRDEIGTLGAVGIEPTESIEGFAHVALSEAFERDQEAVNHAVARLQNEPDRLRRGLLWFRLDEAAEPVHAALREGRLEDAMGHWEAERTNGSPQGRAMALHNLAVSAHARSLEAELAAPSRRGLTDAAGLERSLDLWRQAIESDEAWTYVEAIGAKATDPRVDDAFVRGLRAWLAEQVLAVHTDIARSAARQGWIDYAKAHMELVRASGFPTGAVERVLGDFFQEQVKAARGLIRPALDGERPDSWRDANRLLREYSKIRDLVATLGGESYLRDMADELVPAPVQRVGAESSKHFRDFFELDKETYQQNAALIQAWNHFMDEYNRMPWGFDGSAKAGLREVYGRFQGRAGAMSQLDRAHKTLRAEIEKIQLLLRLLKRVAEDASPSVQEKVEAELSSNDKALTSARTELQKTKDHHSKNLSGMSQNLGA